MTTNIKQYRVRFSDQTTKSNPKLVQLPSCSVCDRIRKIPIKTDDRSDSLYAKKNDFSLSNDRLRLNYDEAEPYGHYSSCYMKKPILKSGTFRISGIIPLSKDKLNKNRYKLIDTGNKADNYQCPSSIEIPIIRESTAHEKKVNNFVPIPVFYETRK